MLLRNGLLEDDNTDIVNYKGAREFDDDVLKYLGYQFSIWASDDITLPPSVINQHFHIWIFSHNFEPN
jgi:hypothetical protein